MRKLVQWIKDLLFSYFYEEKTTIISEKEKVEKSIIAKKCRCGRFSNEINPKTKEFFRTCKICREKDKRRKKCPTNSKSRLPKQPQKRQQSKQLPKKPLAKR